MRGYAPTLKLWAAEMCKPKGSFDCVHFRSDFWRIWKPWTKCQGSLHTFYRVVWSHAGHSPGCIFHLWHPFVCWGTNLGFCTGEDSAWWSPHAQPEDIKTLHQMLQLIFSNSPGFARLSLQLMFACQSLGDFVSFCLYRNSRGDCWPLNFST